MSLSRPCGICSRGSLSVLTYFFLPFFTLCFLFWHTFKWNASQQWLPVRQTTRFSNETMEFRPTHSLFICLLTDDQHFTQTVYSSVGQGGDRVLELLLNLSLLWKEIYQNSPYCIFLPLPRLCVFSSVQIPFASDTLMGCLTCPCVCCQSVLP